MKNKLVITITAFMVIFIVAACQKPTETPAGNADMPNPASVFCEENGGTLDLRTGVDGSVAGVCVFADSSECDEWAYFRNECNPGDSLQATEPAVEVSPEVAESGWLIYSNKQLGYSFEYPADCSLSLNEGPRMNVEVVGPLVNDENWPLIYFNNPGNEEAYRPGEDVDLTKWLEDHYLSAEERVDDAQVAGVTAVHTRHERSPQSYAFDTYYFVKNGGLYSVVILHAGDKEDWELYNHFLESIHFE